MNPVAPPARPLLPVAGHNAGRSALTCRYRCGDACSGEVPNRSDNAYFGDIVAQSVSRRTMLKAGGVGASVGLLAAWGVGEPEPSGAATVGAASLRGKHLATFTPIASTPADVDDVVVPTGYAWDPIISWGDPLFDGTPAFDFDAQTPAAQREQAGYNCDFTTLMTDPGYAQNRGVLAFNNEYTNDQLMFRGISGSQDLTDEQLMTIMAAHGMTIVDVIRPLSGTPWRYQVGGRRNRRIHTGTEFTVDGPAAGSAALQTSADPHGRTVLGTLNNCAGGDTPWGTVLSGEENFNQYFDSSDAPDADGALARYGITSTGRGWERVEDRFSVAKEPNEVNRFGWVVEIDPDDPTSTPVKHTAMGRFKHEGATVAVADNAHVVAYLGDDERFDYVYKFVSHGKYREGNKAHNLTLLSSGDLYVAKFFGDAKPDDLNDGTGKWVPLVKGNRSRVRGFSVEEVLVHTRLAADRVGATKMDRPEDVQPSPTSGRVFIALTNNNKRTADQVDEANPRADNKFGHVMELRERDNDPTATRFYWKLILIAGDPEDPSTYFAGYDKSEVSPISCPDNLAFDAVGNLWIATDGMPGSLNACDGLFFMPVRTNEKGHVQQFLSVPVGAECCGPVIDLENDTVLVAVQHPGEVDGADPSNVVSTFPYRGDSQPRPSVIHIYTPRKSTT